MSVEVKVADQAAPCRPARRVFRGWRNRRRGFRGVDGDADELRSGVGQRFDLATVAAMSAVSVLVIDWTTIGAPPPIWTLPTSTAMDWRRMMGIGWRSQEEARILAHQASRGPLAAERLFSVGLPLSASTAS